MTDAADRYAQKLDAREAADDPIRQEVEQIEQRRQEAERRKWSQTVEQFKASPPPWMERAGPVDWESAARDGALSAEGVPYRYMRPENPNRYMFGVDLATGRAPTRVATVEDVVDPEAQADTPWYRVLFGYVKQVPAGALEGLYNVADRAMLGLEELLGPEMSTRLAANKLLDSFGVPSELRSVPEVRNAALRMARENVRESARKRFKSALPQSDGVGQELVRGMSQYLTAFLPISRAVGATGAGAVTTGLASGAITSALVWEEGTPTLSNLLIELDNPIVNNAVTQYLAIDEDDSEAEQALKQALEDAALGVGVELVLRSVKALKRGGFGKIAALELEGRQMLRKLYKGGGRLYGGLPVDLLAQEAKAWTYIVAGKIAARMAEGKEFTKQEFIEQVKRHWGEDMVEQAVENIWRPARALVRKEAKPIRSMVGAPYKVVRTPKARESMVDLYVNVLANTKTIRLDEATRWWKDSAKGIRELAGNDPEKLELYTRLFAIYGQSASVQTNVTYVLQQLKALNLAGGLEQAFGRFPNKNRKVLQGLLDLSKPFDRNLDGVSDKLYNYYLNLRDEVFGFNTAPDAVTIDTWMGRAFGYTNAPAGRQYEWSADLVRDVTQRLNERLGTSYKPREIQAAIWAHAKNVWERGGQRGPVATFESELRRRSSFVPWEAVPAPETGKLQQFYEWPEELRRKFTTEAAKIAQTSSGQDVLLRMAGFDNPHLKEVDAWGTWEYNFSPNRVVRAHSENANPGKADRRKLELAMLMKQYVYEQHEAIAFRPSQSGDPALLLKMRRTDEEAKRALYGAMKKYLPDMEGTFIGDEFHVVFTKPASARDALSAAKKGEDTTAVEAAEKELRAAQQEGREFLVKASDMLEDPEVKELIDRPRSGEYKAEVIRNEHDWTKGPEALEEKIAELGRGDVLPWLRDFRAKFNQLVERYSQRAEVTELKTGYSGIPGYKVEEIVPEEIEIKDLDAYSPRAEVVQLPTKQKPGAVKVKFAHFSKSPDVLELDPDYYGTGIRGADNARVMEYEEAPNRSYGYVIDEHGQHKRPEPGLGKYKYVGEVEAYDMRKDPLKFREKAYEIAREKYAVGTAQDGSAILPPGAVASIWEGLVRQAGYDGYVDTQSRVVVMFNRTPVERVE